MSGSCPQADIPSSSPHPTMHSSDLSQFVRLRFFFVEVQDEQGVVGVFG